MGIVSLKLTLLFFICTIRAITAVGIKNKRFTLWAMCWSGLTKNTKAGIRIAPPPIPIPLIIPEASPIKKEPFVLLVALLLSLYYHSHSRRYYKYCKNFLKTWEGQTLRALPQISSHNPSQHGFPPSNSSQYSCLKHK